MSAPLARNERDPQNPDVPIIIERPDAFPFQEGERERDWHEATDEEYAAYVAYWDAVNDLEFNTGDHEVAMDAALRDPEVTRAMDALRESVR